MTLRLRELRREVRLREPAARCVRPAGDGEQVVDAAVRRSVGVAHESRLAYRPVQRDERWNGIRRAVPLANAI